MPQDTTISPNEWLRLAVSAGLDFVDGANLNDFYIDTQTRLTALEVSTPIVGLPFVDLRLGPYFVVANDSSKAVANTAGIKAAITDFKGTGATLQLPNGDIYLERDTSYWSVLMDTTVTKLCLRGMGMYATTLIQQGIGTGGEWDCLVLDGCEYIIISDLGIKQGSIQNPDFPGDHNALINIVAGTKNTRNVWVNNVWFGPCIGDAFRVLGDGVTGFYNENIALTNFTMETYGHPWGAGGLADGSRSGVSFQRGFKKVLISNGFIRGAKNSPFEMEPSGVGVNDDVVISNLIIDNSQGNTRLAFTIAGTLTSPLTRAIISNVTVLEGAVQGAHTRDCSITNLAVTVTAATGATDLVNTGLFFWHQDNVRTQVHNMSLLRDTGAPAGPLVIVAPSGSNVSDGVAFRGGQWVARTTSGTVGRYVECTAGSRLSFTGVRMRLEASQTSESGIVFRSLQSMADLSVQDFIIETSAKLTNAVYFANVASTTMANLVARGITCTNCTTGVLYDQLGTSYDTQPILQGCDFGGATSAWSAINSAVGTVFPVVSGNKGGICMMVGTVAPESAVPGMQGCEYIRQNGNSTAKYFKSTGTSTTGWSQVTIP